MDIITYALCKKLVSDASSMGAVFSIKGQVPTVDDLPASGNKAGDLYLVGPKGDGSYDEYYYTANEVWESLGSTATNMGNFVTDSILFSGADGTGTIENPAQDTIMYTVNNFNESKFVMKDEDVADYIDLLVI